MALPRTASATATEAGNHDVPRFMNVKQVARYLQLNEKKVYALVNEGRIPATRLTGKWLFPRDLVDQWLLESSHGGLLTDRIVIAGSDDPLLQRAVSAMTTELQGRGLVSYAAIGTQLGLSVLARRRADACTLHWGPAEESLQRHPALLRQHVQHTDWILVRLCRREQGILLAPGLMPPGDHRIDRLFVPEVRWVGRQEGAGSQRFLREIVAEHRLDLAGRRITARAHSERDAAAAIASGQADAAAGVRAAAGEFGLEFVPIGWEAFDLAMPRAMFFRTLFRGLLDVLRDAECRRLAQLFGGYDFAELGDIVWTA